MPSKRRELRLAALLWHVYQLVGKYRGRQKKLVLLGINMRRFV